jgi:hypothetical protein
MDRPVTLAARLEAERAFDDPLHEHAGNGDHLMVGRP